MPLITNIKDIDNNLILKKLKNNRWELLVDIEYNFKYSPYVDYKMFIPKGLITDLASVPQFLWNIFPPHGNYAVAAIIHDTLYRLKEYPRELADAWFRELMKELEISFWKRNIMYFSVRLFGWTRSDDWLNGGCPNKNSCTISKD